LAGERRYLGVGVESVFGTAVANQAVLDYTRAAVEVPVEPQSFYPGAGGGRQVSVADGASYVPQGVIELGVDPSNIGYLFRSFFGSYAVTGSDPFTHTFKVSESAETLPSVTLRVGRQITEHRFTGGTGNRLRLHYAPQMYLAAEADMATAADSLQSLDTSGKTLASSYFLRREGAITIAAGAVSTKVEEIEVTLENNVDIEAGVRHNSRFPVEFPLGPVDVTGRLTMTFLDTAEYTRFWGNASAPQAASNPPVAVTALYTKGSTTLEVLVPQAVWTHVAPPVEGRDRIRQEVLFRGLRGGTEDTTLQLKAVNSTSSYAAA
jgi:hypothetical protein